MYSEARYIYRNGINDNIISSSAKGDAVKDSLLAVLADSRIIIIVSVVFSCTFTLLILALGFKLLVNLNRDDENFMRFFFKIREEFITPVI